MVLTDHIGTTCDHMITEIIVLPTLLGSSQAQVGRNATGDTESSLAGDTSQTMLEVVSPAVTEHDLSNPH